MDGLPNTPNGASDAVTPETVICPACGAPVRATARFCGACGAEIVAQASPPAPAAPAAPQEPAEPVAPMYAAPEPLAAPMYTTPESQLYAPSEPEPGAATGAAVPPGTPGEGKVCNWCNATSPAGATVCIACGAAFPTPEGDEAIERAAKARIDDMQADMQRSRGSGWWPFRPR